MAGRVVLSRDNFMDSEGCFYNALSTYLEGLEDLERRQVYYVVENDEDIQDGTRDVVISDPIEEGNEEMQAARLQE